MLFRSLTNVYNNPTATFFNLTGLAPATAYEWRVRRICSFSNSNYLTSQFVTLACISSGVNTSEWIRQFTLGNINRASAAEPGGYTNISSPGTDLVIGSTNNAGQIGAGFASTVRNEKFMVFIDFNRNGSFADAGENMISNNNATISGTTLKNFSINIPVTATPGPTRMRVIMNRNSNITNPCITGYWGETEDYMVNLVASGNLQAPNQPAQTKTVEIKTAVIPESKNMISLNVSPNPSSGLFTIDLPATFKPVKYMVVNSMGKTVQQNTLKDIGSITIDLSNLARGIYYLTVFDINAKKTTAKLIVQ